MPTDIPVTKPRPTLNATLAGIAALTTLSFTIPAAAALGWHAGLALARVIGL